MHFTNLAKLVTVSSWVYNSFFVFLETKLTSLPICAVCHVTSCRPVMAG